MEVIGSIYTGVTADFQRGVYPIARCVKAEQHDLGVVMADVNVLGSLEAKFESTNRIYDVGGGLVQRGVQCKVVIKSRKYLKAI